MMVLVMVVVVIVLEVVLCDGTGGVRRGGRGGCVRGGTR